MKQPFALDPVDRKILKALQEDATVSHAVLAEKVGASTASCWRRVKALEASGCFTRTVRLVDPRRVGQSVNVICNVRMRSHAKDVRASFEGFVRQQPEIVECFSMSGDWDYLLRVIVADLTDYNDFLMRKLLDHAAVASASSHFALEVTKYTTAMPV